MNTPDSPITTQPIQLDAWQVEYARRMEKLAKIDKRRAEIYAKNRRNRWIVGVLVGTSIAAGAGGATFVIVSLVGDNVLQIFPSQKNKPTEKEQEMNPFYKG